MSDVRLTAVEFDPTRPVAPQLAAAIRSIPPRLRRLLRVLSFQVPQETLDAFAIEMKLRGAAMQRPTYAGMVLHPHGRGGLIEVWGPAKPVVIQPALPTPKPQAIIRNYE